MQYKFKLSGESLSLASAELKALFDIFDLDFKITKTENNFANVKTRATPDLITKLCERSAFIKRAYDGDSIIWEVSKGRFLEREPQRKPAFHPTTLKPKLARALINLSRAGEGNVLLDPFCGAGSVLIEAGILGINTIGSDFDDEMIVRAKKNLIFYKIKKHKTLIGDATGLEGILEKESVDAIATDLPYGRSSRASTKDLSKLYEKFLSSAYFVLKKNKYLAFLYPNYWNRIGLKPSTSVRLQFKNSRAANFCYVDATKIYNKKIWKIISKAELYVHGSLTRKLLVLQKR